MDDGCCFSRQTSRGMTGNTGGHRASEHLQVADVWREGRPMDEALYVRERCLMAGRQVSSSSSSWNRGIPVISAASGRSPGLLESMIRTILSCTQRNHTGQWSQVVFTFRSKHSGTNTIDVITGIQLKNLNPNTDTQCTHTDTHF